MCHIKVTAHSAKKKKKKKAFETSHSKTFRWIAKQIRNNKMTKVFHNAKQKQGVSGV